ncbi:MAG TPA: hypothetical protein VD789_10950, partial [Thermomicrobiales bacterium]|nr:hypothetical protein [Thermomicrobiales bacterium]
MITDTIQIDSHTYAIRSATREDLPAIVALLADDMLGSQRETTDAGLGPYHNAFERITDHPNQE